MPRERSFGSYLALSALWLLIALSKAFSIIGNPARWVDVLFLLATGMIAGLFLAKAKHAYRMANSVRPEIPGGPPTVPK